MIAVDSGPESLTWQLTKVDPSVKIEKYQVRGERLLRCVTGLMCRSRVGTRWPISREIFPAVRSSIKVSARMSSLSDVRWRRKPLARVGPQRPTWPCPSWSRTPPTPAKAGCWLRGLGTSRPRLSGWPRTRPSSLGTFSRFYSWHWAPLSSGDKFT